MKNKLISIFITLVFVFISVISVNAIARTPRVELDNYDLNVTDINNVFVSGTVSVCKGQLIGVYDSSGIILYNYKELPNTNTSGSFKLQIPARFISSGTTNFKVKSLPLNGVINGSNSKTFTVKVKSDKQDQIITASNLSLKVNETKNINAKVNSNLPLTYLSINPNIATVDSKGNVVGRSKGTTSIKISQDGNNEYNANTKTIEVKVTEPTAPVTKKYTITFNSNFGEGKMSSQTVNGNTSTKLKANAFKRPYYSFAGWAQSKNGKVVYKNQQAIKLNRNMTLYAVWSASYKKPNGKTAEGKSVKLGIDFGKMSYKKGSHSRGIVCVIRAKDPGLAAAIADNAEKITRNNKIGYSKKSGVGPKLYNQLIQKGPSKAKGKASCCPFALCCLKYSMYLNPEYKFATSSKYNINCNWRSDSNPNVRSGMKSVKSKIEKSGKNCPYTMIYDTSKFKNWKTQLYRGDIAICKHHVFVVL